MAPLTDREKAIEEACDQERYAELKEDINDKITFEEEELKRFQESIRSSEEGATFASVPFDYNSLNAASSSATGSGSEAYDPHEATASNDATENEEEEEEDDEEEEEDEPFYVPEILKCPPGMTVPLGVRENAILERTAAFVAKQGTQMEFVLKMKQAGKKEFGFLSFDHPLHRYYKHVTNAIKDRRYFP